VRQLVSDAPARGSARGAADERDVHRSRRLHRMSERLGDRIIPLLSRYFDSVSAQIQQHGGTIDNSSATP